MKWRVMCDAWHVVWCGVDEEEGEENNKEDKENTKQDPDVYVGGGKMKFSEEGEANMKN